MRLALAVEGVCSGESNVKKLYVLLAWLLVLHPALAMAQSLPPPKEFYFDEDPQTTRPVVAIQGADEAAVERLASNVQRRPDDVESRAQLAAIALRSGRTELGRQLYDAALRSSAGKQRLQRAVAWNYGWDLYRAGEPQAALEQWSALVGGWPSTPSWQPPTFALVLWTLGQQREAVNWYAAAVRTEPALWSDPANHARLLPDWTADERMVLAEVHQAWQARAGARR